MSHIHIPDGVLPVWLWLVGWLLTIGAVALAARLSERTDARRKVPLLGVVSALMLVAMSSEIVPLAYHVNLAVLGGIILGPVLSIVAAFIVEVVLAMLGHGGVSVLGLNTVVIATEMVVGWGLFRLLVAVLGRKRVRPAAWIATVLTLALTTTMLVGVVWAGGAQAASRETGALDPSTLRFENPLAGGLFSAGLFSGGEPGGESEPQVENESGGGSSLSVTRFAAVVYTLGPLGWLLEGLVTAWIVGYVSRVRPTLVFAGALADTARGVIPGDEAGGR